MRPSRVRPPGKMGARLSLTCCKVAVDGYSLIGVRRGGPPSMPRAEPVRALPARQAVNMLRNATFYASGRSLTSLVFGVSHYNILAYNYFSLGSRWTQL